MSSFGQGTPKSFINKVNNAIYNVDGSTPMNAKQAAMLSPYYKKCSEQFSNTWRNVDTPHLNSFATAKDFVDFKISDGGMKFCTDLERRRKIESDEHRALVANTCRDETIPCLVPPCSSMRVCYDENGNRKSLTFPELDKIKEKIVVVGEEIKTTTTAGYMGIPNIAWIAIGGVAIYYAYSKGMLNKLIK